MNTRACVDVVPVWTSASACTCNNLFVPVNLHFLVLQWGHTSRVGLPLWRALKQKRDIQAMVRCCRRIWVQAH